MRSNPLSEQMVPEYLKLKIKKTLANEIKQFQFLHEDKLERGNDNENYL